MALSWNEIKDRAFKFSQEWVDEKRERAEKESNPSKKSLKFGNIPKKT